MFIVNAGFECFRGFTVETEKKICDKKTWKKMF